MLSAAAVTRNAIIHFRTSPPFLSQSSFLNLRSSLMSIPKIAAQFIPLASKEDQDLGPR